MNGTIMRDTYTFTCRSNEVPDAWCLVLNLT
nr:MAG TPA: protein of unknown function (DUF5382) [Caudoviricetes sp.]